MNKYLIGIIAVLVGMVWFQYQSNKEIIGERDRYRQNNEALLSDIERIRVDSTTMAIDAKSLRLTIEEYKRFRAEDARKIDSLGLKLRNLKSIGKHKLSVEAPIVAVIRDTVFYKDTIAHERIVEMKTPYIELSGTINNDSLVGSLYVPVNLHQSVWIEYKRYWIFWKKPIAIHQTMMCTNPHVKLNYSEWIELEE